VKANHTTRYPVRPWLVLAACLATGACGWLYNGAQSPTVAGPLQDYEYLIAPGDTLNVFVWQNPDVSIQNMPVRPDGKISAPLVGDMIASGKTSKQLAHDISETLVAYIKDPLVTVTVVGFVGGYAQQVRVVGEAVKPQALPYRKQMTLLDVMIQVEGLTPYADGNKAKLVRRAGEQDIETRVRLEDLVKKGDMGANIEISPGDVIIIPEAWF
jgi:polysaccharide export outer membrane protein